MELSDFSQCAIVVHLRVTKCSEGKTTEAKSSFTDGMTDLQEVPFSKILLIVHDVAVSNRRAGLLSILGVEGPPMQHKNCMREKACGNRQARHRV